MSADPDPALLAAALVFAGAAIAGSVVAIRDEIPGQPCGISVPLTVPAGLLAGWGAGVAAPWPMPVTAVIAAARSQRTGPTTLTGAVCAGIGMVVGLLIFLYTAAKGYLEHHADPPGTERPLTTDSGREADDFAETPARDRFPVSTPVNEPGDVAEAPTDVGGRPAPQSALLVYLGTFLFLPVAGLLAYNKACFGGWLDTGYSHDF